MSIYVDDRVGTRNAQGPRHYTLLRQGKEGTGMFHCASGMVGIEPTPPASKSRGMQLLLLLPITIGIFMTPNSPNFGPTGELSCTFCHTGENRESQMWGGTKFIGAPVLNLDNRVSGAKPEFKAGCRNCQEAGYSIMRESKGERERRRGKGMCWAI